MEVGLAHRARDAGRGGDEEECREGEPEGGGEPDRDGSARLDRRGTDQERRPAATAAREDVDQLVAGDRREGDAAEHEARDPDGVAVEKIEQVGLGRVERPGEEAELDTRREHQQPERALPPAERDARPGIRVTSPGSSRAVTRRGVKAEIEHHGVRDAEDGDEQHRPHDVRDREVDLAEQPSGHRADEHRRARDLLAARKHRVRARP